MSVSRHQINANVFHSAADSLISSTGKGSNKWIAKRLVMTAGSQYLPAAELLPKLVSQPVTCSLFLFWWCAYFYWKFMKSNARSLVSQFGSLFFLCFFDPVGNPLGMKTARRGSSDRIFWYFQIPNITNTDFIAKHAGLTGAISSELPWTSEKSRSLVEGGFMVEFVWPFDDTGNDSVGFCLRTSFIESRRMNRNFWF